MIVCDSPAAVGCLLTKPIRPFKESPTTICGTRVIPRPPAGTGLEALATSLLENPDRAVAVYGTGSMLGLFCGNSITYASGA